MNKHELIPLEEIRAAQRRIKDAIVRTPLVKLNVDDAPAEIYLKLENLQPIGSFKIRGASNAMKKAKPEELKDGVWTMSSGNHGQAVAWNARKLGIECTIHAFDFAAKTKIDAMERLGASVKLIPSPANNQELRNSFEPSFYPDEKGLCIHPFSDPAVMAGQGTIGLEILEDLPDVDAVLMPYGGGGLSCGVASAIKALKPDTKLYGCESETAPCLTASLNAGKPVEDEFIPSFISGIGIPIVLPEMWDLAKRLLDGSMVSSLKEICDTVRMMAELNNIISEGASAVSVAAAVAGKAGTGNVVCVVSGGNIDLYKLVKIFQGKIP